MPTMPGHEKKDPRYLVYNIYIYKYYQENGTISIVTKSQQNYDAKKHDDIDVPVGRKKRYG